MSPVERAKYAIREVFGTVSEADEKRLCAKLADLLAEPDRRAIQRWAYGSPLGDVLADVFGGP